MTEIKSNSPPTRSIVVLGAGVIGLSIAYKLSSDPMNKVIVIARDMPEHLDSQGWSSPWAGANWSPIGAFDPRTYKWEKATFDKFWSMIPTGLVMRLPSKVYHEDPEALIESELWWKDIVRELRYLTQEELIEGANVGLAYTTVSTKPARYLRWMKDELEQRGVEFITKHIGSIEEASAYGGDKGVLINATGLGSRSLLGVEDHDVYPIRGQTVIVNAPHVKECVGEVMKRDLEPGEATYIIPRPDGSIILGGTFQPDNWELAVNHRTARRIFERCTRLVPALLPSRGTTVISHNVGLRPARRGGPRVEIETVQLPLDNELVPNDGRPRPRRTLKVIHAYGFGPAGYQNSWGVSEEVASLLTQL